MTKPFIESRKGIVYTFYSFKGGVGRSMALANVAALLAKWGRSVLVVDWDLEAAGIERFFCQDSKAAQEIRTSKPGIVDLVQAKAAGTMIDWHDCLHELTVNGNPSTVKLISAGSSRSDYVGNLHGLNFAKLFSENDLGRYIEDLRNQWTSQFEFVLIDSRTGVTDIGGICTVHFADVLVLFFTATDSSTEGVLDILERARNARDHLPVDRGRLIAVPVPARDESRTEYETAAKWKQIFADRFQDVYEDWLPREISAKEAVEFLKIPYVPYWSFGEGLPIREGTSDPASLGWAYEALGRLLVSRLNWSEAFKGMTLRPQPMLKSRELDRGWLTTQRVIAATGIEGTSKSGFMEVHHYLVDSEINKSQTELLSAAREAMVSTFGWPIGVVLEREGSRPRATNQGIVSELKEIDFSGDESYDYWTLTKTGDFFTMMSLYEDNFDKTALFFDTRIVRTTEALLHAFNLYENLGAEPTATVSLTIRYGGLRGRILRPARRNLLPTLTGDRNDQEDQAAASVSFRLSDLEPKTVSLVEQLCAPLFVLFNFSTFPRSTYERLVSNFIAGKVA